MIFETNMWRRSKELAWEWNRASAPINHLPSPEAVWRIYVENGNEFSTFLIQKLMAAEAEITRLSEKEHPHAQI